MILKSIPFLALTVLFFTACNPNSSKKNTDNETVIIKEDISSLSINDSLQKTTPTEVTCTNDSLNALAGIIAGIADTSDNYFSFVQQRTDFKNYHTNFDKRWMAFDSSRLENLKQFKTEVITKEVTPQKTLFYPFSGPDILYAQTFFPEAEKYVMLGLEPVGSLPEFKENKKDSLGKYFSKINTSLHAILKFSFFRTVNMSSDLKNAEVDGTLHLIFLFLKRTGNNLCSVKPITIDSLGNIVYQNSFIGLKKIKTNTRGIEIKFTDINNQTKTLYYFSLNAADGGLKTNKGFVAYLKNMGTVNTYLKGASYLMHKDYFSIIRNVILNQSQQVIQDDSGIALHYFTENSPNWNYTFYGQYSRPIPMFSAFYQADLDSLYKTQGSKQIGFGIGYNFRDKNSNFMIATKK